MAKKGLNRSLVTLKCSECGEESHKTKQERFLQERKNKPIEAMFENIPGKCRICKKPIERNNVCNKCLFTSYDNKLTTQERKKRNGNEKTLSFILMGISILLGIIGFIRLDSGDSSFLFFVVAIASFYFSFKIRKKTLCEECGSVNSIVNVGFELNYNENSEKLNGSENVSQSKKYKHIYQCKECGHKKLKYSNNILG